MLLHQLRNLISIIITKKIEPYKELSCANYAGMIELHFKEIVYRVGYLKCEEENVIYHNIPSWFQCQYCEHFNKIYCCTDSHRSKGECSVCGKVKEITYDRPSYSTGRTILYCEGFTTNSPFIRFW